MPRKKREPAPPCRPPRPIRCAFCQKELNPQTDEVAFIGVGKWRDSPGYFHAVCSVKDHDGQENPCFSKGMAWATNNVGQQPVCMTYQEWIARPIRRRVTATRAANGRYELRLTESHLNCIYFLETKHAANADKAKVIVGRWQADWSLSQEDAPDLDRLELDARQAEEFQRIQEIRLTDNSPAAARLPIPEELEKELHRHCEVHGKHLVANLATGGDDCDSCRISRGIRKLYAIAAWLPVIQQSFDTIKMIKESSAPLSNHMRECRRILDDATKSLFDVLEIKPQDEQHNESARKQNEEDIRLAKAMVAKYGVKS
jgi:hypothetical protein